MIATMVKFIQYIFIRASFLFVMTISLLSTIQCEAALPKPGETIRLSGTIISSIGSNESLVFVAIKLDPKIDTGDFTWPKCENAIIYIKAGTKGERIFDSLFDRGERVSNIPIRVDQAPALNQIRGYFDPAWIQQRLQDKMAQRKEKERNEAIEREKAQKLKAKLEFEATQEKIRKEKEEIRKEKEENRLQAEIKWETAQAKMHKEEEEERIREQRIADLKSGKMKITNIEDAKLAFNPSTDNKYTLGLPIDGLTNTGQYYLWSGTLSWKSGKIYYCLDGDMSNTICFGFTNIIVRFTEMRENSHVTIVGKLGGETEVTLINKSSGFKENKRVPLLIECYVF